MRLIDATTADDYLRSTGRIGSNVEVRVQTLAGGVSNVVLRVEPDGGEPFVLKQSRERLRTEAADVRQVVWRDESLGFVEIRRISNQTRAWAALDHIELPRAKVRLPAAKR